MSSGSESGGGGGDKGNRRGGGGVRRATAGGGGNGGGGGADRGGRERRERGNGGGGGGYRGERRQRGGGGGGGRERRGGSNRRDERDRGNDERDGAAIGGEELATKVLNLESKRFYLDVKENDKGRFIKFAEVSSGGRKSRIFMSMRAANAFRNELEKLIDVVKGLEAGDSSPANNNADAEPTLIHTETLQNENRRYFLDLRENNRGRFLRITQLSTLSGVRSSLAVPATGMQELREALAELLDGYGAGHMEEPPAVDLPEERSLRVDNKLFYFDPGHNDRGDYLKISEVKPQLGIRSSITISTRSLPSFIRVLGEFDAEMLELRGGVRGGGTNNGGGVKSEEEEKIEDASTAAKAKSPPKEAATDGGKKESTPAAAAEVKQEPTEK